MIVNNKKPENKSYIVTIMGDDYAIKGTDNPEYIKKIAAYLDNVILEISQGNPKLNKCQIAVLAALKITDELHKLRQKYQ